MKKKITKPATAEKGENENHINKAFVTVPTKLLAEVATKKITVSAYVLYAFLLFWQGTDASYGVKRIAKETGFSEGKVKELLKELSTAGHITRIKQTRGNSQTRCRTFVETPRKVLIYGEPVGEYQRIFVCGAPTDWDIEFVDDEWLRQIPWSEALNDLYEHHLVMCYDNRGKAKRAFIEDIMWETPALTVFAKKEYPDLADSIRPKKSKGLLSEIRSELSSPRQTDNASSDDIESLF